MLHGNDLTEKAVQTAKNILRTCSVDKSDVQLALLNWRNTPRNYLLGSPNQRLFSRITKFPIPITDNNLKPKIIQGATAELQQLREKQVSYSNINSMAYGTRRFNAAFTRALQ